jgi:deazaflavin-dependent oxidoreductase (nitroreductase family)
MADIQKGMMRAFGAGNNHLYRWTKGRLMGKMRGFPGLLLAVAGRKSGVEHTTAVSYFEHHGGFVVTGSAGGAPSEPQWFKDLRHAGQAVIEVGPRQLNVTVAIAGPEDHGILWDKLIAVAPFFAKYPAKAGREIPMAILTPTPSAASAVSRNYHLADLASPMRASPAVQLPAFSHLFGEITR